MFKKNSFVFAISLAIIILTFATGNEELSNKKNYALAKNVITIDSNFDAEKTNLEKKIETQFKYAVFDISRVFWKKGTYDILYAYQKRKGIPLSYYLKLVKYWGAYLFGRFDTKAAYEDFLGYCGGMTEKDFEKDCGVCWEKDCKDFIYKEGVQIFNEHKKNGVITIMTEVGVKQLYKNLLDKFKFDYVCSSELELKNGIVSGKLIGEPCIADGKLAKIKEVIEKNGGTLKQAIFYGSSHLDIPIFEQVGKPVVVNPTKKLKLHAQKKGWQILKFKGFEKIS